MIASLLGVLLGVVVVVLLSVLTGYFVAQEFGYMAVDRSRLKARAAAGDAGAARALKITSRTSFMLSGAQLGITVTGLLVGYVAEPLIGHGIGVLFGGVGVPTGVGVAIGTVFALLLSTVVQMVFGELFPKNLAIARPEPVALRLARSTGIYLSLFGWLIWLFDRAAELLLRAIRIEPVHDVEHAATPRDLEHIVAQSRDRGDLPAELSALLDRVLDFQESTAEHAMIPRPRVTTIGAGEPVREAVALMASGHSRLPVLGGDVDDVVGVVCLREVLALGEDRLDTTTVAEIARRPVMVPASLSLTTVLDQLRDAGEEFACVVDEYGGLAGVVTSEDIAEELVGEITDEHDPLGADRASPGEEGGWLVPGTMHIDEAERLLGHDLPAGDYQTVAGLVLTELQRLPAPGDKVTVDLPSEPGAAEDSPTRLTVEVRTVVRRVPDTVRLVRHDAEVAR
ncbi:hemolysin family protein [Actinophytocola gossypii]|uniref:HlyC/CorC family transporter n=1 Tax=Actinophytocola gossypii TaxID=2812003 RepID=A0ABT2JJJ2_9PSEU|nr:hemolysin family protein [Actinophytocola gossypii]MCT2587689.1 HlyC/CorC family transporter [Actinophytocola gossypii]